MKINKKTMSLKEARKLARNLERSINRLTGEPLRIPVRRSTERNSPDAA
jgi:hypothetical protein